MCSTGPDTTEFARPAMAPAAKSWAGAAEARSRTIASRVACVSAAGRGAPERLSAKPPGRPRVCLSGGTLARGSLLSAGWVEGGLTVREMGGSVVLGGKVPLGRVESRELDGHAGTWTRRDTVGRRGHEREQPGEKTILSIRRGDERGGGGTEARAVRDKTTNRFRATESECPVGKVR